MPCMAERKFSMFYSYCHSPIGCLEIQSDGSAVCAISLCGGLQNDVCEDPVSLRCARELSEYFAGNRTSFSVPIAPRGTLFQKIVWSALLDIPFAETRSYAEIARKIGRPRAVRAVGNAVGCNPILILIPCHRVIRANGTHGGFSAGIHNKLILHKIEGIALSFVSQIPDSG